MQAEARREAADAQAEAFAGRSWLNRLRWAYYPSQKHAPPKGDQRSPGHNHFANLRFFNEQVLTDLPAYEQPQCAYPVRVSRSLRFWRLVGRMIAHYRLVHWWGYPHTQLPS